MKLNRSLGADSRQKSSWVFWGLIILGCAMASGCEKNPGVVWASSVKSPNGIWVAEAKTQQWAGPGNNYVATTVALKWTPKSSRPPIEVLELANNSAYPIGVTSVKMKWITNSHLDVSYGTEAKVNFQAIKAAGLDITAHPSMGKAAATK